MFLFIQFILMDTPFFPAFYNFSYCTLKLISFFLKNSFLKVLILGSNLDCQSGHWLLPSHLHRIPFTDVSGWMPCCLDLISSYSLEYHPLFANKFLVKWRNMFLFPCRLDDLFVMFKPGQLIHIFVKHNIFIKNCSFKNFEGNCPIVSSFQRCWQKV